MQIRKKLGSQVCMLALGWFVLSSSVLAMWSDGNGDKTAGSVQAVQPSLISAHETPASGGASLPVVEEKVIVVATTEGGGGHMTAANAVKAALESERPDSPLRYKVILVDVNKTVKLGEWICDAWDVCFQSGSYDLLNAGADLKSHLGKAYERVGRLPHANLAKFMESFLKLEERINAQLKDLEITSKPAMIISVVNSWNNELFSVAQKLGVPFRIIPTDFQNEIFLQGLAHISSPADLTVYLPFVDADVSAYPSKHLLATATIGYPLKSDFLKIANAYRSQEASVLQEVQNLRATYGIAPGDRSVFAIMGAKGFDEAAFKQYLQAFYQERAQFKTSSAERLHIFVAAGKNAKLRAHVEALAREVGKLQVDDIVYHALPMLGGAEVALHMAAVDVIFSKPGGATTSEILAINKNVVFLSNPIKHEDFNADVVVKNGWGKKITMGHRKKALLPATLAAGVKDRANKAVARPAEEHVKLPKGTSSAAALHPRGRHKFGEQIKSVMLNTDRVDTDTFVAAFRAFLVDGEKVKEAPRNDFPEFLYQAITTSLTTPALAAP